MQLSEQEPLREQLPKLYDELGSWWPLMSCPGDYAEEAEFYRDALTRACARSPRTLLELGSGGGNNASHMKEHLELTLVDRSTGMLDVSRSLNPECSHVEGDMRRVRLGRSFDCVFVHDAIDYIATLDDLRLTIETAFAHCRPSGAALFAPDHVRENFRPMTDCGGHDGDGRALRYLEWQWDPNAEDSWYVVDYAYLLRTADGAVRTEHDRHVCGLFSRAEWLSILEEVGFDATVVPFEHSDVEPGTHEVFVASKASQ